MRPPYPFPTPRNVRTVATLCALGLCLLLGSVASALAPKPLNNDWVTAGQNIYRSDELLHVTITFPSNPTGDPNVFIDCNSDTPLTATVTLRNSVINETITTCAVRNRGNTSRCASTRSFDVSFDTFVPGREVFGVDSLNINGEPNDPSSSRSFLTWQLLNKFGVPSSRCVATSLTVNGTFYGLHNAVEPSDRAFVNAWFGNNNGPRFKCISAQADLFWRGSNRDSYDGSSNNGDGSQGYEWKSTANPINSDYAQLIGFIDFVNNSTSESFAANIERRFDVDSFLRFLAVNVSVGSWDDYWYGSNNFGLYLPEGSERWQWIPYDFDNTFGVDFFGVNWATRSVESGWKSGGFGTGNSPLIDRILAIPEYKNQYRRYLHELRTGIYSATVMNPIVDAHRTLVLAAGQADTRDAFSSTQVSNSFSQPATYTSGASTPAKWGIKPFVAARNSYVQSNVPTPAALPNITINEVIANNSIHNVDEAGDREDWIELHNAEATTVSLAGMYLTDDLTSPTKWQIPAGTNIGPNGKLLFYCDNETTEGPLHTNFQLSSSGEAVGLFHRDDYSNVLIDGYGFPALPPNRSYGRYPDGTDNFMEFYVVTPNANNDNTTAPPPGASPALYINEFMAANNAASGIVDEFGQSDDWIEIYNDELVPVDMSGMYLSDTSANPTKAQIPAGVIIPAKGFLVFWADNAPAQGARHLNFALSASGEQIVLTDTSANGFQTIDSLTFGVQATNIAQGRSPDGGPIVGALPRNTPGVSNLTIPVTMSAFQVD